MVLYLNVHENMLYSQINIYLKNFIWINNAQVANPMTTTAKSILQAKS